MSGARPAGGAHARGVPRGRLPDRARPALRQAHALAPVRHRPLRHRPRDIGARRVLPGPRPPQPLRGGRLVPADLGRRQPGADHRRAGAAGGRPSWRGTRWPRLPRASTESAPCAEPPRRRRHGCRPRHRPRHRAGTGAARASTSLCRCSNRTGDEARGVARDLESRGAAALLLTSDLADVAAHRRHGRPASPPRFGRLDCLVNNAGIGAPQRGDVLDLTPENFDTRDGRQPARHAVLHAGLPARDAGARGDTGHAAHASSPSPRCRPRWPRPSAPTTASPRPGSPWRCKALALRLAPEGIAVFEVRPGIIRTPMTAAVAPQIRRPHRRRPRARRPLGRAGGRRGRRGRAGLAAASASPPAASSTSTAGSPFRGCDGARRSPHDLRLHHHRRAARPAACWPTG